LSYEFVSSYDPRSIIVSYVRPRLNNEYLIVSRPGTGAEKTRDVQCMYTSEHIKTDATESEQ